MADLRDCKKYDSCNWRASVGYCPDSCNHFKHRDEVVVVRCERCTKKEWCSFRQRMKYEFGVEDGYCSAGERRDNG